MIVCVSIEDDYDTSPPFGAWYINDLEQMKYDLIKKLHLLIDFGYNYNHFAFRVYSGSNLIRTIFMRDIEDIKSTDVEEHIDNAILELSIEHLKNVIRSQE